MFLNPVSAPSSFCFLCSRPFPTFLLLLLLPSLFLLGTAEAERRSRHLENVKNNASQVILLVGGSGSPDVRVLLPGGRDSNECRLDPDIPEVPQSYGSPGRVGSIAAFRGDSSVIVCGGVDDGGPPFSSFKDCQTLDLRTRTWSVSSELPDWIAFSGYAVLKNSTSRYLFSLGGMHYKSDVPGPTETVYTNKIYLLDLQQDDPATDDGAASGWSEYGSALLPKPTAGICAVADNDRGHIYVAGKEVNARLDTKSGEWKELPKLGFDNAGCVMLEDEFGGKSVLAAKGKKLWRLSIDASEEDEGEEEDATGWQDLGLELRQERNGRPTLSSTVDGGILVAGGSDTSRLIEKLGEVGWEYAEDGLASGPKFNHATAEMMVGRAEELFPECF